jgi:hypothetical protein
MAGANIAVSDLNNYLPFHQGIDLERDELIERYFKLGLKYKEICLFLLSLHGIEISVRHLKRILRQRQLGRRRNPSSPNDVYEALHEEIEGSGSSIGYRSMHQRLRNCHDLVVSRETVRHALKILDPAGVEARSRHCLQRRTYVCKGPNYIWHIDGYDKLKPFGFCIHGAIDGYTRRILWLEVGPSNNDLLIISSYYLKYVEKYGITARVIRADMGTENVNVAAVQRFFRRADDDAFAAEKSFRYGKSVSNQRIEAWWSILRKGCTNWWINHMKDLRDRGIYNDSDKIQVECLRFCYCNLIQKELHKVATLWNLHNIRPSNNSESPSGRPDTMYFVPEITGTRDYKIDVDLDDLDAAKEMFSSDRPLNGCSQAFSELAVMLMEDNRLNHPSNAEEATTLYLNLLHLIDPLL